MVASGEVRWFSKGDTALLYVSHCGGIHHIASHFSLVGAVALPVFAPYVGVHWPMLLQHPLCILVWLSLKL
jgi:hypothetical protein